LRLMLQMCVLVTPESCAKTAEVIEVLFGAWTRVGPMNHALGGGPYPPTVRGNFGGHSRSTVKYRNIPREVDIDAVPRNRQFSAKLRESFAAS